jgi:hypothetical protein
MRNPHHMGCILDAYVNNLNKSITNLMGIPTNAIKNSIPRVILRASIIIDIVLFSFIVNNL